MTNNGQEKPGCLSVLVKWTLYIAMAIISINFIAGLTSTPPPEAAITPTPTTPEPVKKITEEEQIKITQVAEEKKKREAEAAAALKKQELESQGLIWVYSDQADKMGRGTIQWAIVKSLNEVNFDFPYSGAQKATLELRKHPKYGKDIILNIERGQFLCHMDDCSVSVRFDQGKAQSYNAAEPADNSTVTLFIRNFDRFLSGVRKAKKLYIEAQFYQEGNQVFEFDVSDLKW